MENEGELRKAQTNILNESEAFSWIFHYSSFIVHRKERY